MGSSLEEGRLTMTVDPTGDPVAFRGHPRGKRRRRSLILPLALMVTGATVLVGAYQAFVPSVAGPVVCVADDAARVVPASNVLFGVNLDWEHATLESYREHLGHAPSVVVQFSDIPYDEATWEHTVNAAEQVRVNGGALLLTLEPHGGLVTMSDEVIALLVSDLKEINDTGVPVIVRFAHEMNGSWYAWGQQPTQYVEAFRRLAAAIHAGAPGSSTMWAPNYGGGYPFTGGQYTAKRGSADFAVLDTDGDLSLTMNDDSYAPYFPGDDAVDWAGLSLYHWGNTRPWGNNEVTEPRKFEDMLTGNFVGLAGDDSAVPDFYQVYGVEGGHPVAIPETAAIYTPSRGGVDELTVKQEWWRQIFVSDFHERFPEVKMINWFEWNKYEIEINDDVDWRAANSPTISAAFKADLPDWLTYAEDMSVCS